MKTLPWTLKNGTDAIAAGTSILNGPGGAIVSPTKVGYIIMTTDRVGLDRKFELKERPKRKPGVVLLDGFNHMGMIAQATPEIQTLYRNCFRENILLGCILPWKEKPAARLIPKDGSVELVTDHRNTSCFVVRYGEPSEQIVKKLWHQDKEKLVFASSANPSGKGNRGRYEGIGERILSGVDLGIEADEYVRSQQPSADEESRWAQGAMVSFVDDHGNLSNTPTIIRHGLALEQIKAKLAELFGGFVDSHGSYH
jgi:tRNA A37 threonylcarbamoyladenosine synthetase subunit TsaC/SUA5/YrdC